MIHTFGKNLVKVTEICKQTWSRLFFAESINNLSKFTYLAV